MSFQPPGGEGLVVGPILGLVYSGMIPGGLPELRLGLAVALARKLLITWSWLRWSA